MTNTALPAADHVLIGAVQAAFVGASNLAKAPAI